MNEIIPLDFPLKYENIKCWHFITGYKGKGQTFSKSAANMHTESVLNEMCVVPKLFQVMVHIKSVFLYIMSFICIERRSNTEKDEIDFIQMQRIAQLD